MKLSLSYLGGVGGAGAARAVSEKNAIFKKHVNVVVFVVVGCCCFCCV